MLLISVCIPTYNRPAELAALLEAVTAQEGDDFEIVISDDCSPRFAAIESAVNRSRARHPRIPHTLHRNDRTIGYDANLRWLLGMARGEYCLFMGDDDLLLPGAIQQVRAAIRNHAGIGVVLRSYYSVDRTTRRVRDVHRHFTSSRLFPAGVRSVTALFRRSVHISGYTVHRATALSYDTDQFDGTLLYQLYLTANILLDASGFYLSDFLVVDVLSDVWDFGTADVEREKFSPGPRRPEQCVHIVEGMLKIARSVQEARGVAIYEEIRKDVDCYVYGPLTWQAHSRRGLVQLVSGLRRLGLGRSVHFWATVLAVLLFGRSAETLARWLKVRVGHSQLMGATYQGVEVPQGT